MTTKPNFRKPVSTTMESDSFRLKPTKLPNFTALHQRQFDKMESLVDHIARKDQRAKSLLSSGSAVARQKEISHIPLSIRSMEQKSKNLMTSKIPLAARTAIDNNKKQLIEKVKNIKNLLNDKMPVNKSKLMVEKVPIKNINTIPNTARATANDANNINTQYFTQNSKLWKINRTFIVFK